MDWLREYKGIFDCMTNSLILQIKGIETICQLDTKNSYYRVVNHLQEKDLRLKGILNIQYILYRGGFLASKKHNLTVRFNLRANSNYQ
jgi:hypothetical protein